MREKRDPILARKGGSEFGQARDASGPKVFAVNLVMNCRETASNFLSAISIAGGPVVASNTPPMTNLTAIGEPDLLRNGKSRST